MRALAGDRLALEGGREVRLAGVEAPTPDAPWGVAARAALERLAAGRRVDLLQTGATGDATGVAVAQVRVADGPWLQAALVEGGFVRVRPRPGERALAADLLRHETAARARRRGVWSEGAYGVRLPDEFGWSDSGLQLVEGRVRRVGRHGGRTYLDFADEYRGRVSAEIDGRALRDWRAAGLDPESLRGRLVRVRGPVQGFHMTVEAPEAVEVLRQR